MNEVDLLLRSKKKVTHIKRLMKKLPKSAETDDDDDISLSSDGLAKAGMNDV